MTRENSHQEDHPRDRKGTMHRVFKVLAWANGLAAIGLSLLLALPSFIDWREYKDKIAQLAQERMGVNVKVDGAIYAQFLPVPVFKLNKVTISNPQYPDRNPIFVKRVDVELALFALMRGELDPRAVLLQGADLVFGATENKSLTYPLGLQGLFLGEEELGISRFGLKNSGISVVSSEQPPHRIIDDINFVAEKTDGNVNWSLEGDFMSRQVRHDFQLETRARPEKRITFIDAKFQMTSGGDLTHSFNGSISAQNSEPVVEGRYKSNGQIRRGEKTYAVSARGLIEASNAHINLTGLNLSATQVKSGEGPAMKNPLIVNGEIKARQTPHAGRWALQGNISAENMNVDIGDQPHRKYVQDMQLLTFMNGLARSVDGQISLRARNSISGGGIYPSFYANLSFYDDLVHLADAGLGLPDGGRLQTDRLSARKILEDGKEQVIYEGAIFLKTENVKDLARIFSPNSARINLQKFSSRPSDIALSGLFQMSQNGMSFSSRSLRFNGASGRAGYKLAEDSRQTVSLALDNLNMDRLLRTDDKDVLDVLSLITKGVESDGERSTALTRYNISIGKLLLRGTSLNDVSFKGQLSDDKIQLDQFTISGLNKESFSLTMKGEMTHVDEMPKGVLHVDLTSPKALDALSLIVPRFITSEQGKRLMARAHLVSPLSVQAKLESSPKETHSWLVKVSGNMAGTQFSSEGSVTPNWDEATFKPKHVDLQFELSNPDSRLMAGQLFPLPKTVLQAIPETEGFMRASLTGTGSEGYDIALGGEISDLQVTLGGNAKLDDSGPSVAAQVKLFSPTSRSLLNFVGYTKSTDRGKTEFSSNLVGSGDQFILSGGHGIIGGRPFNIDAKLDVSSKKPVISMLLRSERLRSEDLKRTFNALLTKDSLAKDITQDSDVRITLASPLMSLDENIDVSNAEAHLTLHHKKLRLTSLKGQLFGGDLIMKGEAENTSDGIILSTQYELQNGELERALVQENTDKIARGKFTLAGESSAKVKNISDVKKALQGRGYVKAGNGELRGMNPAAFGRSVRFVSNGTELDGMIGGILSEGTIPFNRFQTAYTIKDGVIETSQTQLISREVRSVNKTKIDLATGKVRSDWIMTLQRLPGTPALKLIYSGQVHNLTHKLEHGKLRTHLMALMRKGEKLSQRFAANLQPEEQNVDSIHTGTIKKKLMKRVLKLNNLTITPQTNPLRGSN